MTRRMLAAAFAFAMLGAMPAAAQEPVKIGFITTLSGPAGYLGQDIRDAFQLAIDAEGGKLGGIPVQLLIEDDGLKPGLGKQIADRFMKTDNVKLFTGIVFSNVAGAVVPDIVDAGHIFVSSNAGPSNFAGKDCNKNYFVMSWLTDTMQGSAGQNATQLGYKQAFVLAPNYQAGKDAIEGFKRLFKGKIVGEVYTRLDRLCFGDGANPRSKARRRVSIPSGRTWHRVHAAIPASGTARRYPNGRRRTVDGCDNPQSRRERRAWN